MAYERGSLGSTKKIITKKSISDSLSPVKGTEIAMKKQQSCPNYIEL